MENKQQKEELMEKYSQGTINDEEIHMLWKLSKEEFTEFEEEEYLED